MASAPITEQTQKRQPVGQTVGLKISPARVRQFFDGNNLNASIKAVQTPLKADVDAYYDAKQMLEAGKKQEKYEEKIKKEDGTEETVIKTREAELTDADKAKYQADIDRVKPVLEDYEAKLAALSRERTRVANDAPLTLAIVCEAVTQELGTHAMESTLAAKKKIVQVEHVHAPGIDKLSLYPLFKSLPSFVSVGSDIKAAKDKAAVEDLIAGTREKAFKEFKKLYGITKPKGAAKTVSLPAPQEEPAPAPLEEEASKTKFQHYVHQVCKHICSMKKEYEKIRFSKEFKEYISDLIVELIGRLSSLVHLVTGSMKIKTVNEQAIMKTVELIMIDGCPKTEKLNLVRASIQDPVKLKAEFTRKEQAKQQGLPYKVDLKAIPLVEGYQAKREIVYESCGFKALAADVAAKLALLAKSEREQVLADPAQ